MIAMIPTTISPLAIARGSGDGYLFALNDWLARRGGAAYVRPMPEMNGHWNAYCAYTKSGRRRAPRTPPWRSGRRSRESQCSCAAARQRASTRNSRASSFRRSRATSRRSPAVRIVWNPQGYGCPDLPGNSAQAYYPGDRYVDVVGERPLLHPRQGRVGRRGAVLRRAPVEAVRVRRVGPVGARRAELRPADGALREDAPPRRAHLVLQRQARLAVGPRLEASQPRGVQAVDRSARALATPVVRRVPPAVLDRPVVPLGRRRARRRRSAAPRRRRSSARCRQSERPPSTRTSRGRRRRSARRSDTPPAPLPRRTPSSRTPPHRRGLRERRETGASGGRCARCRARATPRRPAPATRAARCRASAGRPRRSPSAAGGDVQRALRSEHGLRSGKPGERHAERRAGDVVEPELVAERDRRAARRRARRRCRASGLPSRLSPAPPRSASGRPRRSGRAISKGLRSSTPSWR